MRGGGYHRGGAAADGGETAADLAAARFLVGASDSSRFAESRRLPSIPATWGGAFPDHELAGGFPIGLMQADLVLILGTRLDWTVGYGRPPLLGTATKTIHVDIEASVIGQNRPATVGLVGDIKAILRQLERSLDPKKMQIEETWPQTIQVLRQAARESAFQGVSPVDGLIHPALLCRELGALLPPETMLVVDGGDIAGFAVLTMEARTPASLIWIGAFGHLGVGLPFALAGGLANPERPVVLLTGDGAFGLSAMEFVPPSAMRCR